MLNRPLPWLQLAAAPLLQMLLRRSARLLLLRQRPRRRAGIPQQLLMLPLGLLVRVLQGLLLLARLKV